MCRCVARCRHFLHGVQRAGRASISHDLLHDAYWHHAALMRVVAGPEHADGLAQVVSVVVAQRKACFQHSAPRFVRGIFLNLVDLRPDFARRVGPEFRVALQSALHLNKHRLHKTAAVEYGGLVLLLTIDSMRPLSHFGPLTRARSRSR